MAHAEVVAHLVGHGGSHANGILRVVLDRGRFRSRRLLSPTPDSAFTLVKPHSLTKVHAFNYTLHLPIIWDGERMDKERMAGSVISAAHLRNKHSKSFTK